MPLRVAAFVCFCFTGFILPLCPFFRSSRRGVLLAHWCLLNWCYACDWLTFSLAHTNSTLLPLATFFIALDHALSAESPSRELCPMSAMLFALFLFFLDLVGLVLVQEFRYEASLVLLSLMVFVGTLLLPSRTHKDAFDSSSALAFSTDSLFSHSQVSFSAFGRVGFLLYISILCQLLLEIIPQLHSHVLFTYLTYMGLTFGTLDLLTTPAFLGGFLNSLKTLGAYQGRQRVPQKRVVHL